MHDKRFAMRYLRYLVLLALFLSAAYASGQDLKAAIVFDASGSMWERIGKNTKIEIAKSALKDVVAHWDSKIPLGLTIYGHRRKGDCNDIEIALKAAKLNKEKILRIIKDIKPKGKTPITLALEKTAKELEYLKHPVTLILISDGKETCSDAPIQAIKELKAKGKKLTIHVIGFNVNRDAATQLKTIAETAGGSYLPAKDAATLNRAVKTIATKVQKTKPVVIPKNNLLISASETKNGKWVKAFHELYRLEADKNRTKTENCLSYTHTPCKLKVPAGKYLIESSYNLYNKVTQIEAKEYNISKVNVVMGRTGRVSITARERKGDPLIAIEDLTILRENNKTVKVTRTLQTKAYIERLPIGNYSIQYEYHGYRSTLPFKIVADKTSKIEIITGETGRVSLTASEIKGGKYITAFHTFFPKTSRNIEKNITASCYSEETKPCIVQLPVGDYIIESSYKELSLKTDVKVRYQKILKKHIIMKPTGRIKIVARESNKSKPIVVSYIISSDTNNSSEKNQTITAGKTDTHKPVTLELLVGKYGIDANYCNHRKHLSFEVKPNSSKNIELFVGETGYATLFSLLEKDGQAVDANYTLYKDKNSTENIIVAECQKRGDKNYTLQLPVGDYVAEAHFVPFVRTKKFHVRAGKRGYVQFVMKPSGSVKITVDEENGKKGVRADNDIYPMINGEANQSDIVATCYSEKNYPCNIKLPVGKYLLFSRYNHFERKIPFEIKEDKVLPLHITVGQTGDVNITAYDAPNGNPLAAYHYIYKAESNTSISITDCAVTKHCIRRLPVGEYVVNSEYDIFEKRKPFSVQSNKMTQVDIILDKIYPVRIEVTLLPSGKKVRADYEIYRKKANDSISKLISKTYLLDINEQLQEIVKMCTYKEKEQSCTLTLPTGDYILKNTYKGVKKETQFKVKKGESNIVNVTIDMNSTKE